MLSVSALVALPRTSRARPGTHVHAEQPRFDSHLHLVFPYFPKKRKLNVSWGQETAAAPPRAGAPVPRVCPKGMAAALLQALLAVAGAPSPSRNGRATIARRRSVSGIRRPARVLHSRARHGAGVRRVTNGRKRERAPPRPRLRPRAHKLCHSLWTNVAALLRQVFVGPCDEHPQGISSISSLPFPSCKFYREC